MHIHPCTRLLHLSLSSSSRRTQHPPHLAKRTQQPPDARNAFFLPLAPPDVSPCTRFLRGLRFPDKVVQIQEVEPLSEYDTSICSLGVARCHSYNDLGLSEPLHSSFQAAAARLPPLEEIRTLLDRSTQGMLSTFSQALWMKMIAEYKGSRKKNDEEPLPEPFERKQQLYAERVLSVHKRISDEDCMLLGIKMQSLPMWLMKMFFSPSINPPAMVVYLVGS